MNSSIQNQDSSLSANGRFGRLSYLGWNMLLGFLVLLLGIIAAILVPAVTNSASTVILFGTVIFAIIVYITLIYFTFIFTIRRLHDKNQSGWLSLLMLIPLINLFFFIYLSCVKGDESTNNYGSPRTTQTWEKVLAWIYIIVFPISILLMAITAIPAYQSYIERAQQIQLEQNMNYSE
ncbi:DUF805 domain-containing protein [Acinetobacter silvestris]|uniref:DUF805 domain-containing protein n=1 Tax=Acinetobacter silvestris TaxID=1977882 RepID=A0A1Y3CKE7_9GAMM|nr:DUF805 domain-containing protein [Acinetobacter silvestris]OTG67599.1 hypothetical protein B9T28_02970 [Acinetobacter silvestris]